MPPKKATTKSPVKGVKPSTVKPRTTTTASSKAPTKKTVPANDNKSLKGTAGKKGNATAKGKTEVKKQQKPKEKVWTKEDEAAKKIQTHIRCFLARKQLERKKKNKEEYEVMMDRLEKEAYAQVVKMEQEKYEKERQKEENERKRQRENAKRRKRMLEAAFDGDMDEIKAVLKEVEDQDNADDVGWDVIGKGIRNKHLFSLVECEDANNNTPLSEASSGGSTEAVKFLIDKGAYVNSRGHFRRTPLYRAAFAGHLETAEMLLQNGADPRLYADDGQNAEQVASIDGIIELLQSWDISQTEAQLKMLDSAKEKRAEEEKKRRAAVMNKLEDEVGEIQKEYDIAQKSLNRWYTEVNKRINEHDTAVVSGYSRTDVTLQAIHDAEAELDLAKVKFDRMQRQLATAKLKIREQMKNNAEESGDELPGLKVTIKELDDVLLRDVGDRIKNSGKWPLIMDSSDQVSTFLRYRDTNYLCALSPKNMEPEKIRMALLGAIRYGKPLVLDMMEVDMFQACTDRFDMIEKGLMDIILDKTIITNERYHCLLREGDSPQYAKNQFIEFRVKNFNFILLTKNPFPSEVLLEKLYPIRIHVPTKS